MLAGSLVYDLRAQIGPAATAKRLAMTALPLLAVGYALSCLSTL